MFVTYVKFDSREQLNKFMRGYCNQGEVRIGKARIGIRKFKGDFSELRAVVVAGERIAYIISMSVQEWKELYKLIQ